MTLQPAFLLGAVGGLVCAGLLYLMIPAVTRSRRDFIGFLAGLIGLAAVLWFTLGVAIAVTIMLLGGSPGLGRITNGHYYLGAHGRYREVTPVIYNRLALAIGLAERMGVGLVAISPVWFSLLFVIRIRKRRGRSEQDLAEGQHA